MLQVIDSIAVKVQVIHGPGLRFVFGPLVLEFIDSKLVILYLIETRGVRNVFYHREHRDRNNLSQHDPNGKARAWRAFFFFYSISSEYHIQRKTGPTILAWKLC